MPAKLIPIQGGMSLLPAKEGTCPLCATDHKPNAAHDLFSLFYGVRFKGLHGRDPTWADAVAHLPPNVQAQWRTVVDKTDGVNWTEPPEGVQPIAEPVEAAGEGAAP